MPLKDPEARRAYQQEYNIRTDHAGKERARYHNDPARRAAQTAYRLANKEKYAIYQQNSRRRNAKNHLVIDARGRAKKAGIPCTITVDTIDWVTHCPILGTELVYVKGEGKVRTDAATLDRRVNDLGYVPGNVFVISHRANRLKSDATVAELEAILRYAKP